MGRKKEDKKQLTGVKLSFGGLFLCSCSQAVVGSHRVRLPPPFHALCPLLAPQRGSNTGDTNREVNGLLLLLVRQGCHRQRGLEKSRFEGEGVEFSWLASRFYSLYCPHTEILPPSLRRGSSSGPCMPCRIARQDTRRPPGHLRSHGHRHMRKPSPVILCLLLSEGGRNSTGLDGGGEGEHRRGRR